MVIYVESGCNESVMKRSSCIMGNVLSSDLTELILQHEYIKFCTFPFSCQHVETPVKGLYRLAPEQGK